MMVNSLGAGILKEWATHIVQIFPMAWIKRRIPWWATPYNWVIGEQAPIRLNSSNSEILVVLFGNLVGSLFFDAILVKCTSPTQFLNFDGDIHRNDRHRCRLY